MTRSPRGAIRQQAPDFRLWGRWQVALKAPLVQFQWMIGIGNANRSRAVRTTAILLALAAASARAAPSIDATESALSRCLDDPANASTAGQTECETAARRAYDRRMNAAYATLMRKLPAQAAQRLRSSQRAWLAFRDKETIARSALYETRQGTMFVPMQAAAVTEMIRARAQQLESYVRVMAIE
jgi:uncharacterized protein YecT (DUF1311 family)